MKIKIIALSIFFLIYLNCKKSTTEVNYGVSKWTKVESGITEILNDIDFTDNQNGWIVGDSGIVLHSENGGETWKQQTCPIEEHLSAIDFVDSKSGWICSKNSILHTTNSGEKWEVKYTEDLGDGYFSDIRFLDTNTGWVVGCHGFLGSKGVLLKTENGGDTWQQVSLNGLPKLTNISILDEHNIWVCGFGGTILLSTDRGLTWENRNLNISPAPSLTTIQFVDQCNGWTSSRDDWLGFFRTMDGGNTWVRRSKESLSIFGVQTFFFIDSLNGWLATFPGAGYAIAKTTDGGQNWEFQLDMGISRIHSFCFINRETGWAVGLEGDILLYK